MNSIVGNLLSGASSGSGRGLGSAARLGGFVATTGKPRGRSSIRGLHSCDHPRGRCGQLDRAKATEGELQQGAILG
eukprot:g9669.t1